MKKTSQTNSSNVSKSNPHKLSGVQNRFPTFSQQPNTRFPLIQKLPFGTTVQGHPVSLYKMVNGHGMEVHLLDFGCVIHKLLVPMPDGSKRDTVLGFPQLSAYEGENPYFGSIIGRYANRIADGRFMLDGKEILLSRNENSKHLHGGHQGFDKKVWTASTHGDKLVMEYQSPDGEEGFPGNLKVRATFRLTKENALEINHTATTDKPTVVSMTRHEYFNFNDGHKDPVLDHNIKIKASQYLVKNMHGIPTGERKIVPDNMDFRAYRTIRSGLPAGYDTSYILDNTDKREPNASILSPEGKIRLDIHSNQPGIQFFTAPYLGDWQGKYGKLPKHSPGLCLEPQHFPDSPNHPGFPSTVLRPGETYAQQIIYKFGVSENPL